MRSIGIALFCLALTAGSASAEMANGEYRVEGTNLDGSGYRGRATITPTSDTTCRIRWETGSTSIGICMMVGQALAASYVLNGKVGLVLYAQQSNGSLKGIWTVADQPGAGTEILIPAK
jgi:hypothetical protein